MSLLVQIADLLVLVSAGAYAIHLGNCIGAETSFLHDDRCCDCDHCLGKLFRSLGMVLMMCGIVGAVAPAFI